MITLGGLVGRQVDQLWCPPLLGTGMKPVTNRSGFRLMHYLFKHLQKIQNLNFTSSQTFTTFSNVQTILSIIKRSDDIGWRLKQTTQQKSGRMPCLHQSLVSTFQDVRHRIVPLQVLAEEHHLPMIGFSHRFTIFFHCAIWHFPCFAISCAIHQDLIHHFFCLCHLIFHVVLPVPLCHLMHVIKRYLKWFSSWATHNERICWMSQ